MKRKKRPPARLLRAEGKAKCNKIIVSQINVIFEPKEKKRRDFGDGGKRKRRKRETSREWQKMPPGAMAFGCFGFYVPGIASTLSAGHNAPGHPAFSDIQCWWPRIDNLRRHVKKISFILNPAKKNFAATFRARLIRGKKYLRWNPDTSQSRGLRAPICVPAPPPAQAARPTAEEVGPPGRQPARPVAEHLQALRCSFFLKD